MTPGFDKDEVELKTKDGWKSVLCEPLTFTRKTGEIILIPEGTGTDGASTPKILWPIIPPFGDYFMECLLHDFLYRCDFKRSKKDCDLVLLEAMEIAGVGKAMRATIYWGVRMFGKRAFDHDRKKKE